MSFVILPGIVVPPLTAGAVPYGTGTQVLMNAQGTAGQVLLSNGAAAPTWANTAPSSSDLAGGVAGDLPYQQAPNDTTFLNLVPGAVLYGGAAAPAYTAVGTAGELLQSNGTGAPSWINTAALSGAQAFVTMATGTNQPPGGFIPSDSFALI